jgi:hypothetical protein
MYSMRRTTIFLDGHLLRQARQHARREGKSFAALVRESLVAFLAGGRGRRTTRPPLPSLAGRLASGRTDTSERVDELLRREPHD